MHIDVDYLVLSARSWRYRSDEPFLWAYTDPYRVPLFEVRGLSEHGTHQRSLFTRAAFQAAALPVRISAAFSWAEQADFRMRPSAVITARSADSLAMRLCPEHGDRSPGHDPGVLIATRDGIALLEAENPAKRDVLDQIGDAVAKYTGPLYRLGEDFAGTMNSTANFRGRTVDHGGTTQTFEVVEKTRVGHDQIAGYDVVRRKFRRLGYEEENRAGTYLRITFVDDSCLDLHLADNPDSERVLRMVRDGSGSPSAGPSSLRQPPFAAQGWLRPGETCQRVFPHYEGVFASTIAGRTALPHTPAPSVPALPHPRKESFGHPSDVVVGGDHLGDEWVHDLGLRGWISAAQPDQTAVAVADMITAGNGYAWLVLTDQRIAVAIAPEYTRPETQPEPPMKEKLRIPEANLTTWWEAPIGVLRGIRDERHGRTLTGSPFARLEFADGSSLLIRQ
ncbi:hypothetical protein [Saccharopolyspora cebuensis]|uniref:Uncharacterized protein n=1 Tax=Saccharopolyspora cebuensis TaxID=418759 RepID=A0ABV4CHB5_9PSEU